MSISNAQKHELLIRFNQERQMLADDYEAEETKQETEAIASGTKKAPGEYEALHSKLGKNRRNGDIGKQLQSEVDAYTDNQLSTSLHHSMTAGYSMGKYNQISDMKATFQGKVEEPVDKIYFRMKDEINQYAEAYAKCKDMLGTKDKAPKAQPDAAK